MSYTYDANGNIKTISENSALKATFTYDGLNQLTREDNVWLNKTITYTYGLGGNLLNKKTYAYTTGALGAVQSTINYSYSSGAWKDLMTAYNGQSISYDAIGNPLSYDGYAYTWKKGRQLASISGNSVNLEFKYDHNGLRTKKNNRTFIYAGSQLMMQMDMLAYNANYTNLIRFLYDASGTMLGLECQYGTYYYQRNLQGDVIGILDTNGNVVVNYLYDSWGKLISTTGSAAATVGLVNPIRYRGYYYDTETGLYYCQSRYYSPEWGRWLNADLVFDEGSGQLGANLFVYCANNPINLSDASGYAVSPANVVGAIIGAIIGLVGGLLLSKHLADKWKLTGTKRKLFIMTIPLMPPKI